DEPTSALDVTVQKQVLSLLQRLQGERALSYLLITHDMDVIRAMAHHVCVLKDGQVVESGPWQQVLDAPQHPYTQALVAASQQVESQSVNTRTSAVGAVSTLPGFAPQI
ncbi:MAG: hypothetical protein ACOVO0_02315, partial [Burkholderiaceae bacterium]